MKLILRPIDDSDIKQVQLWLNKPHVLKWYHDADEWLYEIRERNRSFGFLHHFIVLIGDKPIGFGQYYDCFDAKEEWYIVDKPNEFYSIDYFIGEEEYLRKGYGKEIVRLLVEKIQKESGSVKVIVQPEEENIASCKVLLSNGFIYDRDKEFYSLGL